MGKNLEERYLYGLFITRYRLLNSLDMILDSRRMSVHSGIRTECGYGKVA